MTLSPTLRARLAARQTATLQPSQDDVLRGSAAILTPGFPQSWTDYIGQEMAQQRLLGAITRSKERNTRLDHVLLSGPPGLGKSSLARLIIDTAAGGMVEISGKMTAEDVVKRVRGLQDGDALLLDECHATLVGRDPWGLRLLQEGVVVGKFGTVRLPEVTVIAVSSDTQQLTEAMLSRFPIQITLTSYTEDDGIELVKKIAGRMDMDLTTTEARAVTRASNNNPRTMRQVLTALRDTKGGKDLPTALAWCGLTEDGLDKLAQEYLLNLLLSGRASERSLLAALGEPGSLKHVERLLFSRGLVQITTGGRTLTNEGIERAEQLAMEEMA